MQLRNIWTSQAVDGTVRVNALSWLNKATLDIIGLAGHYSPVVNLWPSLTSTGFNYNFNSLSTERPTELATAFSDVIQATTKLSALDMIQAWVPVFRVIVSISILSI
jgi:hypothetical protein